MTRFILPLLLFILFATFLFFHVQFMRTDFGIVVKQCSTDTRITRDEGPMARSGYRFEVWEYGYSVRLSSNSLDELLKYCVEKKK